jgi:hypothetical protein
MNRSRFGAVEQAGGFVALYGWGRESQAPMSTRLFEDINGSLSHG